MARLPRNKLVKKLVQTLNPKEHNIDPKELHSCSQATHLESAKAYIYSQRDEVFCFNYNGGAQVSTDFSTFLSVCGSRVTPL
jgi:hypothetical protein